MNPKPIKYLFWPLWFIVIPGILAVAVVWLLRPGADFFPTNAFEHFRLLVREQVIPAGIVFFTIFEMLLYHYRYALPWAGPLGIGGRSDLPRELRREFEQANQLLDEVERIQRRHKKAVERTLSEAEREELTDAVEALRLAVTAPEFRATVFEEARDRASDLIAQRLKPWRKNEVREYVESITIAVAVALLLRAFVVEAFKIPTGSMLPTLQLQDHIFVNKFAYGVEVPFAHTRILGSPPPVHGDVMVFANPENPEQDYIKRVMAVPGDVLTVDSGHPIINGWRVPSCRVGPYEYTEGDERFVKHGELFVEYLNSYSYLTLFEAGRRNGLEGPYRVDPGEVWVLGDNRNNSADSRAWYGGRGGGVPFENIRGRAMFIWMNFGSKAWPTWNRLFTNVMGKPRLPEPARPELVERIEECLANRPPVEATTPPPPRRD